MLYKVQNGVRSSIAPTGLPSRAYGVKHEVPGGQWNVLRVVFNDKVFLVFFTGEQLFQAEDQTFVSAGKTGLWTKADSQTWFSKITIVKL